MVLDKYTYRQPTPSLDRHKQKGAAAGHTNIKSKLLCKCLFNFIVVALLD